MTQTQPPAPVGILVRDMIFSSRITAEARAAGATFKLIRDPAQLQSLDAATRLLIVDLNLDGAIAAAAQWRATSGKPVIGFVSHVDTQTIEAARATGIDQILPRSRFVQVLGELFR